MDSETGLVKSFIFALPWLGRLDECHSVRSIDDIKDCRLAFRQHREEHRERKKRDIKILKRTSNNGAAEIASQDFSNEKRVVRVIKF